MDKTGSPGKRMICRVCYLYLKLLEKTVTFTWQHFERLGENQVIGFWHEDSLIMNLILKKIAENGIVVSVLVTGDDRGDYIEYIVEKCGGKAMRMDYETRNIGLLKELLRELDEEEHSVAIAMDGPLGPRHEPKKITFFLSEKGNAPLVRVTLGYKRKLILKKRWDHYRIPLPFARITVQFEDYGVTPLKRAYGDGSSKDTHKK